MKESKKKIILFNLDKFLIGDYSIKNNKINRLEAESKNPNHDLNFLSPKKDYKENSIKLKKEKLRSGILEERARELDESFLILKSKIKKSQNKIVQSDIESLLNLTNDYIKNYKNWIKIKSKLNGEINNSNLLEKNSLILAKIQERKEKINNFCQDLKNSYDLILSPANSKEIEDLYVRNDLKDIAKLVQIQRKKEILKLMEFESKQINEKYRNKLKSLNIFYEDDNFKAFIPDWNY